MFSDDDIQLMRSALAYGSDGVKIGGVGDVYLDDASGQPTWVTVASGLFGTKTHFVPLTDAALDGERLTLGFTSQVVESAPRLAEDEHLGVDEEDRLYAHYGVIREDAVAPTGEPVLPPATQPAEQGLDAAAQQAARGADDHLDETELDDVQHHTEEARQAAEKADPLGDGSYAGDASKAPLVDTKDLGEHSRQTIAPASAPLPAAAAAASDLGSPQRRDALPEDVLAQDRVRDADARAREDRWALANGEAQEPEDDGL